MQMYDRPRGLKGRLRVVKRSQKRIAENAVPTKTKRELGSDVEVRFVLEFVQSLIELSPREPSTDYRVHVKLLEMYGNS